MKVPYTKKKTVYVYVKKEIGVLYTIHNNFFYEAHSYQFFFQERSVEAILGGKKGGCLAWITLCNIFPEQGVLQGLKVMFWDLFLTHKLLSYLQNWNKMTASHKEQKYTLRVAGIHNSDVIESLARESDINYIFLAHEQVLLYEA